MCQDRNEEFRQSHQILRIVSNGSENSTEMMSSQLSKAGLVVKADFLRAK
jgi:hypothetical protein